MNMTLAPWRNCWCFRHMRQAFFAVWLLAHIGCSSSSGASPACTVEGTYAVASTKQSGNCDTLGAVDLSTPTTMQFIHQTSGDWALAVQGLSGTTAVKVDACKATVSFDLTNSSGVAIGTFQGSYSFDANGLSGSSTIDYGSESLPDGGTFPGCSLMTNDSARRR